MIRKVPLGNLFLYADDAQPTGLAIAQNGINYEIHIRKELERLIPTAKGFIDIGANVGVHSMNAKDIRPDIFVASVEMLSHNLSLLCRSYVENKLSNYVVIPVAVASRPRIIAHNDDLTNTCCWLDREVDYANYCAALPISFYALPPIDLIKIDVEGFEFEAWRGMEHFFEQRATMIFEFCLAHTQRSRVTPQEMLRWLMARRYRLTVLDYKPGIRRTFEDAQAIVDYTLKTCGGITDILAEPL